MIIHKNDNVEVDLETGHKTALTEILPGSPVIKYGYPIGVATSLIRAGEPVHTHNLKTALTGKCEYRYAPEKSSLPRLPEWTFEGYLRADGSAGIRNEIWIIPTVGCVNGVAKTLARLTGAVPLTHPFGCSQLGGDLETTRRILRGLSQNPNAAGVLILGLGCENNQIGVFRDFLGAADPDRVKFLNCQDLGDEIAEGMRLIAELSSYRDTFSRRKISISKLHVGLKCGGSDGLSGITANPMVGRFTDRLVSHGGSAVMTEVPEMFGAETILLRRAQNRSVFDKTVSMINGFKEYFLSHGQEIYENPSPGNIAGGITTLEEKSLGCVTKGGQAPVTDVLSFGEQARKPGLSLLYGPGNDLVACTNLAASGCQIILFTTGRGTPLGSVVPTVKISTNTRLSDQKKTWIDFDAESGTDEEFDRLVFDVIGENTLAKNERNGYREISIFKEGVIL